LFLDLFDGESESESESKTPCRKSNRTTSKSATLQEKNGLLDNGNKKNKK